jgi:RHS repeat-associated protein
MSTPATPCASDHWRLVGDPVDVVTGANTERTLDFRLTGPLEFKWLRCYDSSKAALPLALGFGHTHHYDRQLRFDVDGISYLGPVGWRVGFPPLLENGAEFGKSGLVLRRVSAGTYRVFRRGEPAEEFEFRPGQKLARLKRVFNAQHELLFLHDAQGRLTQIRDSLGRNIQVTEDSQNRITSLTLAADNGGAPRPLISYQYDAAGTLAAGTDPYRSPFRFEYDAKHRMTRRTDRRGYSFLFAYDGNGRCVHSRGEDSVHEVRLRYLLPERVTVVTKADGGEWTYFYDETGTITRIIDACGGAREFVVDAAGRVTKEVDPKGGVTTYAYDGAGNRIQKRTPAGKVVDLPEDENAPDPLAHRIARNAAEYEYGSLLKPAEILPPDAGEVNAANVPEDVRPLVATLSDEARRLRLLQSADAPPLGPRWFPDPPRGRRFDDFGKLVQQEGYDGRLRRWLYDPGGSVQRYTDFDGAQYNYQIASWNLRVQETSPIGAVVKTTYTPSEQVAAFVDAGGTRSEYVYDLKDRLVEVRRHGAVRERYHYDEADNLTAKLDAKGQVLLAIENSPANLPIKKTLASGGEHHYEYDHAGRVTSVTAGTDRVDFAYDRLGNRRLEKRNGRGVEHLFWNWRQPARSTLFERFVVRYDRLPGNTVLIIDPGGQQHRIRPFGHGMIQRRMSNGTREFAQFDDRGRCLLKSIERAKGRGPSWHRSFRYSGEGDLQVIEDNLRGHTRHEYDAAHRLRKRIHPNGRAEEFELDLAGNLTRQPGLADVVLQPGNRLKSANGFEFDYNERHHLARRRTAGGETRYFYDSRERLVRAEINGAVWEAEYDPLGRRTRKTWAGRTTEFFWDTDRLLAELHSDGRLRFYIYADSLSLTPILFMEYDSVDAPLDSGRRYFVFCDQIGTPVQVEDENGEAVWRAQVEPFGRVQIPSGATVEMPLRFPGHYFDVETGLHYNRFRYYDPVLGRYLQSDPLGITGGDNLYAYPANPLSQVDARGLGCPECEARARPAQEGDPDAEQTPRLVAHPGDEESVAAVAKAAGMEPEDLANLQQHAQERKDLIIIRDSNEASLQHHDDPMARPKPEDVKMKTDPQSGLVTDNQNWDNPEVQQNFRDLRAAGWDFDDNGVLRDPQGRAVYGDHDLQGVYTRDDGSGNYDPNAEYRPRTTNLESFQDDINSTTGNRDMFQHGANDDYRPGGEVGRYPRNNESFTVIDESGHATRVGPPTSALKQYYEDRGIPWPYGDYPKPNND